MYRNYPTDPSIQPVKGIIIFKGEKGQEVSPAGVELLKSLSCEVLTYGDNRITITTSRGKLQEIKKCWLSQNANNKLSVSLNEQVSQIIIGGNVR